MTEAHYHDCIWGAGGKHICFKAECASVADSRKRLIGQLEKDEGRHG